MVNHTNNNGLITWKTSVVLNKFVVVVVVNSIAPKSSPHFVMMKRSTLESSSSTFDKKIMRFLSKVFTWHVTKITTSWGWSFVSSESVSIIVFIGKVGLFIGTQDTPFKLRPCVAYMIFNIK